MRSRWRLALATALAVVALSGSVAAASAATVRPDGIIIAWEIQPHWGQGVFGAQDTNDSGTSSITFTFAPSVLKDIPNAGAVDNVQALVAAMKAPDWGAAVVGSEQLVFSSTLLAKFQVSRINVDWVYQRLYAQMDPGATPPPYVPRTPQAVDLNGQGAVGQPPKPVAAQPTPVVVQHPIKGTQMETVPAVTKTAHSTPSTATPATTAGPPVSKALPQSATPAQQITAAKAQEAQNAVVAVKPSPKAPAVLVPGAHIAPGWRVAQKTIERVRAVQQRMRRQELEGAALAALIGLFFLAQRRRHAWPFRRGWRSGDGKCAWD